MQGLFTFTVDDNIIFLEDLTKRSYASIFDHPYLAIYKRLHERQGVKIQLNLFYEKSGFDLSLMTDSHKDEWKASSDWLKLSFHSRLENVDPYKDSAYEEVFSDCATVHREILRFAGKDSLAATTTVHCCRATADGIRALNDNGVKGLLGLYGTDEKPRSSYQTAEREAAIIRAGDSVYESGIAYAGIDIVLNTVTKEEILSRLDRLCDRKLIKIMIHEQYFYDFYHAYQPDFEEKITAAIEFLNKRGYESAFFEDTLADKKRQNKF